jgi:phosphatidylglycerol:prolipoprotein diacylglycerol transferase
MYPTIFNIPVIHMPIYAYGLMMVAAFLACQWLSSRLALRYGIDPEIFVNVTLFALVAGVIGSRLSHVLENTGIYFNPHNSAWDNFVNIVNIRSGGLTFYGGLILAAPVVLAYLLYKKVPARVAMDITAPCITLGLAIGRIGCFLNGCCYGADTNLPWGLSFPYYSNAYIDQFNRAVPGETLHHDIPLPLLAPVERDLPRALMQDPRYARPKSPDEVARDPALKALAAKERSNPVHPAQLYSTITSLLITAMCLAYLTVPHAGGRVLALMLLTEGPTRFLLEMLRVEPPVIGRMSLSMVIGAILFVIGAVLWVGLGIYARRHDAPGEVMPGIFPAGVSPA